VIRAYGEAANAIARVTATSPTRTVEALLAHARSMHECATSRITNHTADLEACFGALVAGIPPQRRRAPAAEKGLQPWATTPADCVTWRRFVLAATTLLGEPAISSMP
jgi:hypothetical protein